MQKLQETPLLRRKFIIDDDLKRYEKALRSLYGLDVFEELKDYTQKHELYNSALEMYKYQKERFDKLMTIYAEFLNGKRSFKEAGIGKLLHYNCKSRLILLAYEYLNDYAAAVQSYTQVNLWREALYCAELLHWPSEKVETLAIELAESLEESKDLQSAATIYAQYLGNFGLATKLLCRSYQFAEATRLVIRKGHPELLQDSIDPGLLECFNTTTELIADCKAQIAAQVPRLRELRIKKEEEPCTLESLIEALNSI
jgi:elongator complex protein 1